MTYSRYNKFRIFAEAATTDVSTGSNGIIRDDDKWINYDARTSGLLPGDFISSITLNTALRQATFMSTLLAESIANSNIVNDEISTSNLNNAVKWAKPVGTALRYGYNLSTNNIKVGGNFNNTFTAQFGPDLVSATGDVIPVPVGCYRFSGYQNLNANTLVSIIPTTDSTLTFRDNDPNDARGDLYAATVQAQYGILRTHVGMTYDNYDNLSTVDDRIVTMQELKQTSWLSAGVKIQPGTNLNSLINIGNYYALNDTNISNIPLGTKTKAFTLKVSSVPIGSNSYIQQQFTQCDNGNTYTRIRGLDGSWGGGWSVDYNTTTAAMINFTRDVALQCGCTENSDHTITVPVKALIQCATNNYSTRACLRVGGVGGTVESNPSYFGIQIEGLPKLDDFLVHLDMKFYNSDTWITLEQATKTYQCFYNSNYFAETVNGQPNPYYNAKPIWIYVPRTGNRTQVTTSGVIPDAPTGNIGSNNQPVYLSDGVITPCTYTIKVANTIPYTLDNNTIYFVTEG